VNQKQKKALWIGGGAVAAAGIAYLLLKPKTALAAPASQITSGPTPSPSAPPPCDPNASYWRSATNADVSADGTESDYVSMLNSSNPIGYSQVIGQRGSHVWKLTIVSSSTDPNFTTYARDVHGYIADLTDCTPS